MERYSQAFVEILQEVVWLGNSNSRKREIFGIMLFAISMLALVSLYVQTTGWFDFKIKSWLEMLFGNLAPVFGVIGIIGSLNIVRGTHRPLNARRQVGYVLLLLVSFTIYHLFTVYHGQGYQLPPSLSEEIAFAKLGSGAGVLGALLMVLFLTAFGVLGSYIILASLLLIGIILVFSISFIGIFRVLLNFVKRLIHKGWDGLAESFATLRLKIRESKEQRALKKLSAKAAAQAAINVAATSSTASVEDAVKKEPPKRRRTKKAVVKATDKKSETVTQEMDSPAKKSSVRNPKKMETEDDRADELVLNTQSLNTSLYQLPPAYLLKKSSSRSKRQGAEDKSGLLEETFASFGISAQVVNVCQGPVVTRYELTIGPGTKVSKITSLADDLALALAAADVRIEAPVPGKSVIGIEVPNKETQPVLLRDVIEHPDFINNPSKVALALGKDIAGNPVIGDLKKWLHLLVAGATGSGKSVCLNAIISSILFRANPDEVKLMLIDPKRVELSTYDGIPHLITPVVTDPKKAATALRWVVAEMERRYKLFADSGAKNIDSYHQLATSHVPEDDETPSPYEFMPQIVIVIDELADLMMVAASDVEESICRIAQMARAAGIYLVIATQRPSVDVITGLIKANVPSRISFAVSSQVDSRTILDMGGAERLIGKGDMLYYPLGANKPNRAQGAWISDSEVEALVSFWKKQGEPEYRDDVVPTAAEVQAQVADTDELFEDAVRLVVETGQASISMLQRRFRIGYARAARLIDMMEVRSIVGPNQGSKPREVLIDSDSIDF